MSDQGQKTEKPSARRRHKARDEGKFPASREFVQSLQFLVFVAMLAFWSQSWFQQLQQTTRTVFHLAFRPSLTPGDVAHAASLILWNVFLPLGLAGGILVVVTLLIQLMSTNFGFSLAKLAPSADHFNPVNRLKDLPRKNLAAFAQALVMLTVFGWVIYWLARKNMDSYLILPLTALDRGLSFVSGSLTDLLWKAAALFFVFGSVDLFRQKRKFEKDLRMTKQEVREEMKEAEGNPQIKMRIRRLQRDLVRRRMMSEVPKATAVIVNPTHYAVAIRYEPHSMVAPVVVAKGKNYLALRIRQKALDHQVPLVENVPLAQGLYKSVDVGQEIPSHLYRAVAEVLAYIHRLMQSR